jgi:hypothetical protein
MAPWTSSIATGRNTRVCPPRERPAGVGERPFTQRTWSEMWRSGARHRPPASPSKMRCATGGQRTRNIVGFCLAQCRCAIIAARSSSGSEPQQISKIACRIARRPFVGHGEQRTGRNVSFHSADRIRDSASSRNRNLIRCPWVACGNKIEVRAGSRSQKRRICMKKDAYACQTGYSAYASLWENAEDGLCSESAPLPSRFIRSIRPSAVI